MEIIYFLLLMIIIMLLVLIISIKEVNKNIIKLYIEFNSKLIDVQETITNVYQGHKYKKSLSKSKI